MGKITSGGLEEVKVKVKRNAGNSSCGAEMVGFISCLDANGGDERLCATARDALGRCMELAARSGLNRRRHKPAINFHLQQASELHTFIRPIFFATADGSPISPSCPQFLRGMKR
jgi:hypothetical protein